MSNKISNEKKFLKNLVYLLIVFFVLILTVLFVNSFLIEQSSVDVAKAETTETIYIYDEFDFEIFLLDSANTNLITKGDLEPITSATDGKKYVLCNDIYLSRKNLDLTTSRIWNAHYFNGTFEGRGHSIVNFELDANKPNVNSMISNTYGYAFFGYLGDQAIVKDINFLAARIDFEQYNGAILAGTNYGSIDNVKVEGIIKTKFRASGICVVNFGTIQNSLSIVDVDIYDELNSDISSGYITSLNNQNATIGNNLYYDFANDLPVDSSFGKEFYLDESDLIVYQEGCSTIIEPIDNDYLSTNVINDYFGTIWYLNLFVDTSTTEIFYMINDINLFNVNFSSSIYNGTFPEYFYMQSNNFYNREKVGEFYIPPIEYGVSALPSASTLEEIGSKEYPYIINNLSDLLACANIESNGIDYVYKYYRLGNDINLRDYSFSSSIINQLQGEFDGNNYSISSINGVSLFGEIGLNAIVKNLRISGKVSQQDGLLSTTNYGDIKSIDIDFELANANGVGVTYHNYGSIERATVRTQDNSYGGAAMVGLSYPNSSICYSRSLHFNKNDTHEVPFFLFAISDSEVEIVNCSNLNNLWNLGIALTENNIWIDNGEIVTNESSIYELITKPTNTTGIVYHKNGWGYCNPLGTSFAFILGQLNDNIELVFPSDNHLYKTNSFFSDSYNGSEIVNYYGERPGYVLSNSLVENMLISNPTWSELDEINGPLDEDGILVRTGGASDFNIGVSEEGLINRSAIEWITLFGLNTDVKQLSNFNFIWEFDDNPFVATFFTNPGLYSFVVYNDYFDCYGSFYVLPENLQAGLLDCVRKEYYVNTDSVFFNSNFIGISDDTLIIKKQFVYDEFDIPQELPTKFINQVGRYMLTAEILSSETIAFYKKFYEYRLNKGNMSIALSDFESKIGGLDITTAPEFYGDNYDFSSSSNLTVKYLKPGYEIQVQIQKLIREDNTEVFPSVFALAGNYISIITLKVTNYNDITLSANFYIKQKPIIVDLSLTNDEIVFGEAIIVGNVLYSKDGEIFNYPLQSLSYYSNYSAGSSIGTYQITPTITIGADNNNYAISFGVGDSFSVVKAELDLSEVGFISKAEKYDFLSHDIQVDITKVKLKAADLSNPEISCIFEHSLITSSIPFAFIEVGIYDISATFSAGNNYNSQTIYATLSITHREIKIYTNDEEIDYGDLRPLFSIYSIPIEGEINSSEVISQLLMEGVIPSYTCEYISNSTTGWPNKLSLDGLYYELPITLSNVEERKYKNFEIVNNLHKDGMLKVNKKVYSMQDFSTSFVYSGNPVNIIFLDGVIPSSRTWFSVENNIETTLSNAPVNVSVYQDGTRPNNIKYRLKATFSGNYKYLASNDLLLDFDITQANLDITGLYLFTDGVKGPLVEGSLTLPYIGKTRYLSFDNQLPLSDSFLLSISCNSITYLNQEVPIKNSATYSNINYEISCVGIQNYSIFKNNYPSSILISPKTVYFASSTLTNTYLNQNILPNFILEEGSIYEVDEIGSNSFSFEILSYEALNHDGQFISYIPTPQTIFYPGKYSLKVSSLLNNYILGDENQTLIQLQLDSAQVELDLNSLPETQGIIFEETYLNLKRNSLKPINIAIPLQEGFEAKEIPIELTLNVEDRTTVEPGLYNINGAREILKIFNESIFVPCVKFTIKQNTGDEKVLVKKRGVSFSWASIIDEELVYNGEAFSYPTEIEYTKGTSSLIKLEPAPGDIINLLEQNTAGITKIYFNIIEINHVGQYELIATPDISSEMSSRFILVSTDTRNITILPRIIKYSFSEVEIFAGDSLPDIAYFSIVFEADEQSAGILEREISSLTKSYSTTYNPETDFIGDFDVNMHLFVDNGSDNNQDYLFVLSETSAGRLIVRRRDFSGLYFSDNVFTYDGLTKTPIISGAIPPDSIVQISSNPINVGEYPVLVTIIKKYYNTKELNGIITIVPATPDIILNDDLPKRVLYRSEFQFNNDDIDAYAIFKGVEVPGSFSFNNNDSIYLKFGLHNYSIRFTPESSNLTFADGLLPIESYLDETDVSIIGETNYSGNSEVISDALIETESDYYRISLSTIEGLPSDVNLFINGLLIYGGQFTFYEDMEDVIVEIKTQDGVILTQNLTVKLNNSGENIVENPEETIPTNPVISGTNSSLSGGAIAGIAVGASVGVGGIVFLIIFLIKKKGKL